MSVEWAESSVYYQHAKATRREADGPIQFATHKLTSVVYLIARSYFLLLKWISMYVPVRTRQHTKPAI